jgi:hypothetical protein
MVAGEYLSSLLGIGTCFNHLLGLGILPSLDVLVNPTASTSVRVI